MTRQPTIAKAKSTPIKNFFMFWLKAIPILLIAGGVVIYFQKFATKPPQAPPPMPPPAEVSVKTLAMSSIRIWTEYSGRLHAVNYAEIRPEVTGRITEVRFQDGAMVKTGDVLFVIDPRPFKDAVDRDNAAILSAKARLELAQLQQNRMTKLMQTQAISQEEVDNANSQLDVAKADVQTAEATLQQAQVDLDHCYVTAPITGRTSRAEVTVGNFVETGSSAPLLTTIVSLDSVYADFDVDEHTYVNAIRAHADSPSEEQKIPVALVVNGDKDHVYNGFIQNFDNQIDSSSGTIRARAKFENQDGALAPGMFVTVRLASSDMENVVLVPERAISFDQNKKSVLIVDNTNHVVFKEVTLGRQVGSNRIVEHGLMPGDRVIVDGLQHAYPSSEVVPHEAAADSGVAEATRS